MQYHIRFDAKAMALHLLDQRYLPTREDFFVCTDTQSTIEALQVMVVRGAPAIGVTAAYGCVLALQEAVQKTSETWQETLEALLVDLAHARPTAVNLAWGVERMRSLWSKELSEQELSTLWLAEAQRIHAEDIACCESIGKYGADCIADGATVMTHCNAGALATAGYGTALGVIRGARDAGKKVKVIANETRPFLQGARLTAYELAKDDIEVTVACDNACALLMQKGLVDCVVVGADRIAANGDAANKIGTYGVALLAKAFNIPFYVAAPLSTIDRNTATGAEIPIEERPDTEVTHVGATQIVPDNVPVFNFAFDVTPSELIAGIITEKGVLRAPYNSAIIEAFAKK